MNATATPRSKRQKRHRLLVLLSPVLAGALLTGCSGGDGTSMSGSGAAVSDRGAQEEAAAPGAAAPEDAAGGAGDAGVELDVSERTVISTADLSVEVPEITEAADAARTWTVDAGGYVAAESVSAADDSAPSATLTLKVPADRYDGALEELAGLGEQVNLDRRVEDVTEEVADVESRVDSAEASLERLRELLEDAGTVEEVLSVEGQISTRQAELESLQARRSALADQTAYGTVHLELLPPDSYVVDDEDDSIGFLGGLAAGWRALLALFDGVAVVLGWLLPFLVLAAVIAAPAWLLLRRRRRARAHPAPAAVAAEAPEDPEEGTGRSDPA
ncbi:hypothetical protein HDA32_001909 [Spinactinospora alkalitolerans]|uniref:DUF4349 domain-containing protein n=1 Tax=Spinactinospora alkalitolerans TaxID=687207 RepID=A0A852TRZ6_9ACTN|nr:DUF4349 domain-containing protein [Spinactinospora alkalitolerans]NYE46789.1 hypothetical protein [Spinactinospora alkalitolerans]